MPALEADLRHLIGADWRERIAPVPSTSAYAARILEAAEEGWAAGVIAHHYTRYLGDLSGGQMIARRVAKQHGLDAEQWQKRFTAVGRPGPYLRVLEPGTLAAGDEIVVEQRPDHDVTVSTMFRALTTERHLLPRLAEIDRMDPEAVRAAERYVAALV